MQEMWPKMVSKTASLTPVLKNLEFMFNPFIGLVTSELLVSLTRRELFLNLLLLKKKKIIFKNS